mmetsp:Transcript_67978/g.141945  ORF Transcript_67978/g.141945 Transcript_67978/m.141945 type:complete len:114 (+) Transcript_67978:525-866(+)
MCGCQRTIPEQFWPMRHGWPLSCKLPKAAVQSQWVNCPGFGLGREMDALAMWRKMNTAILRVTAKKKPITQSRCILSKEAVNKQERAISNCRGSEGHPSDLSARSQQGAVARL